MYPINHRWFQAIAVVYLMDKEGRFVAPFSLKRRPAEAADALRKYL